MADARNTESPRARWQQRETGRLGGWTPTRSVDGEGPGGEPMHWCDYQHRDGRRASVLSDGRCTNPELGALLAAQGLKVAGSPSPLSAALLAVTRRLMLWLRR